MTKVLKCSCPHSYQDSRYGKYQRVHNQKKDATNLTCTVCGTKRSTGGK